MTTSHGGLLIAFIALFNTTVGSVMWSLIAYAIHQYRAKHQSGDGVFHQTQALFRNSVQALAFARNTVATGWQWHNRTPHALRRTIPFGCLGLFIPVLFAVAGILSSRIAIAGDVLYHNTYCGTYIDIQDWPPPALAQYNAGYFQTWTASMAYARGCYSSPLNFSKLVVQDSTQASPPATDCNFFVKPQIPWNVTYPGRCPFQDACSVPDNEVVSLDTGLLDSGEFLGQNQPEQNRVLFRILKTCSPLKTEGFSTNTYQKTPLYDALGNISWYSYGWTDLNPLALSDVLVNRNASAFMDENNVTFVYPQSSSIYAGVPYDIQ